MTASKTNGVVNIRGRDYITVALRVSNFRETHYDWSITTDVIHRDESSVVMKATIADETGRVRGTGYAEENRTSSQINRTSALENCETSAIGRALAACGFGGTEYASANEVENAIHQGRSTSVASAVLDGVEIDEQSLDAPEQAIRAAMTRYMRDKPLQGVTESVTAEIQDAIRALDHEHIIALERRFDSKQRNAIRKLVDWSKV